ncbi:MAG TPA: TIGR03435 family protein [Acidobacteriaceae bacterium]|nr:TIGR03435 family protein [Acidobacteriaceae bacterium]
MARTARPAFEVVSIRSSQPDGPHLSGPAMLADGYRISIPIWTVIQMAYYPNQWNWMDRIQGGPAWLMRDRYDITAKVSDTDLPEWTRQKDLKPEQRVLLQQMLQSMLADRCKLVAHRVPATISGFALVVEKRGPHLTPSTPGATLPVGMKLPDGGVNVPRQRTGPQEIRLYNATMADLAGVLNPGVDAHPIVDKTGLAGHFDIVLPYDYDLANVPAAHYDLGKIGLRLEPVTIPFWNLVIDHIEKPSEN